LIFFQGDDFGVIANLNRCDDCDWNYVNVYFWVDNRYEEGQDDLDDFDNFEEGYDLYRDESNEFFKNEIRKVIEEMRVSLGNGNLKISKYNNRLNVLNGAWDEASNDVWEEVDLLFKDRFENYEGDDRYYWIKIEQERREKEKEIRDNNYLERRSFYEELFSGYDKRETIFTEEEWGKRLIEVFKERGEEICNNNEDDNENGSHKKLPSPLLFLFVLSLPQYNITLQLLF